MSDAIEVVIKVSDSDTTLTDKHVIHENFKVSHEDATLSNLVQECVRKFKGEPEDVVVKIKYVW